MHVTQPLVGRLQSIFQPLEKETFMTDFDDSTVSASRQNQNSASSEEVGGTVRSFAERLRRDGTLIIDGAMSTALERLGANLNDPLWTAKVLMDEPELVAKVHEAYARAGADVAITCSYQASAAGLAKRGLSEKEAYAVIKRSVELAREGCARGGRGDAIVAGAVGPYGAFLADGSEYRGDYHLSDDELRSFHALRLDALKAGGCDLYAVETQPQMAEIRTVVQMAAERDMPCWVTMTHKAGDPTRLPDGTMLIEAAAWLDHQPNVVAVGLNCVPKSTAIIAVEALRAGSAKPLILYPNSGETYDPATKTWHQPEAGAHAWEEDAMRWKRAGVRCLGGCCRTLPEDIRAIRAAFSDKEHDRLAD